MKKKKYSRRTDGSATYTKSGVYFVTICVKNRATVFGNIKSGKMVLSDIGIMVQEILKSLATVFQGCELDEFMVMPNHVHILLVIDREKKDSPELVELIDWFKKEAIEKISEVTKELSFFWERSFYQHHIKDNEHLKDVKLHIRNNPLEWELDKKNPDVM
jgi:putative transposase